MENYIGKTQIIPVKNIRLTVTEQRDDKLIIELDDGRFFRSDIEHWNKGFDRLNHLSDSVNNLIGEKAINKDGRAMEIVGIRDRFCSGDKMKLSVRFEDCGDIVNASYGAWKERRVISPPKVDSSFLKPVSDKVRQSYIGKKFINSIGEELIISDYINAKNVSVMINGEIKKCSYKELKDGVIKSNQAISNRHKEVSKEKMNISRIGEQNMSSNCGMMEIIEYNGTKDIVVKFLNDGTIKKTTYKHFKEGKVESDYLKIKREKERIERAEEIERNKKERELYRKQFVGKQKKLSCGRIATIVDFFSKSDIIVDIDGERIVSTYSQFEDGFPRLDKQFKRKDMIGSIVENSCGTKATIVEYNMDSSTYTLSLDNRYSCKKDCLSVENKSFTTPYDKTYGGIGYLGEGYDYSDYPIISNMWHSLLDRVVVRKGRKEFKAYEDCYVCDRWLCFSSFCEDMLEMWYDCGEDLEIDKDIKYKGNKVYSKDNCLLVPHKVNMLFQGWNGSGKTKTHPVGIHLSKSGNHKGTWVVKPMGIKVDNGKFRTGVHKNFTNEVDAWNYYKYLKYEYSKKILDSYGDKIPEYVRNYCLKRVDDMELDDYLL